jgi:hypothetical protein
MELYTTVLFVHVTAAAAMFAGIAVLSVCESMMRSADTLDRLRMLAMLTARSARAVMLTALILLASALYLVGTRWGFQAPWVSAAFVVFFYLALSGPLIVGRRIRAAVGAAFAEGAISPAVRRRLNDPLLSVLAGVRVALLVLLVFFMTTKPGLNVTVLATVVAVMLGVVIGTAHRVARPAEPALE